MVKVSVVMPVYNKEKFLNDSVSSILNQSMDDLELICVDDGSDDRSLDILNEFAEKDNRVKVFALKHLGGGNARNYGLKHVDGEYLYMMDADDILDLNAFEDFYPICKKKNLDFLVFKAINYGVEKAHYFETEYQNMTAISKLVKDNVFNYKDLGDLLFDFNVSPWCKFYNAEFIRNTGARFREKSKFHDNQFFWDMIFQAERIYFVDEFYYTRNRYDGSLTASGDSGHVDMIGVANDIIKLFIKHDKLNDYKEKLYNLKITWITDRYNQVKTESTKEVFFAKMKEDYENLKGSDFEEALDEKSKFIFNCAIISDSCEDFDLLRQYGEKYNSDEIRKLNSKISKQDEIIRELSDELKDYIEIMRKNRTEIDRLKSENGYLCRTNGKLEILNLKLIDELENKNSIWNLFSKNKTKLLE